MMKKLMIVAAVLAMMVAVASPALAQRGDHNHHHFFFDRDNGVSHDFEQDADSGDVNQSFDVSSTGDNSNQCVGITGNANTGNAQNQIGLTQYFSDADDFEFDDVGADLTVTGTSTTTCDQEINQAAAAG
jgi:hypothetical protein